MQFVIRLFILIIAFLGLSLSNVALAQTPTPTATPTNTPTFTPTPFTAAIQPIGKCVIIAQGSYNATATTSLVEIPAWAKHGVFITTVHFVSGTNPTLSIAYKQSASSTAATSGDAVLTRGSITSSAGTWIDPYVTSAVPQLLLPFQFATLTIGGTNPVYYVTMKVCLYP